MASTDTTVAIQQRPRAATIAINPPSRKASPSLLHQRPRAASNPDMHSIFDAVVGLTSLGAPSPGNSPPCPIKDSATRNPSIEATKVAQAAQDPPMDKPVFLKPALKKPIATTHMHPMNNMTMAAPISTRGPAAHYLTSLQPPYLATVPQTAWPSALNNSSPWTSIHPSQSAAGFGSLNVPLVNPHSTNPFSATAMGMNRFTVADRVAAMHRAAAVSATSARPSPYPYYHHYPSCIAPLPLPTPHQATPIPNTKNFPETLFDVISLEEHAHVISWLPHGRGFIIHDKQRFASMILARYFDGAKFTSFTRRLKRWSFVRVPRGPELGAYYNKNFIRHQPELVQKMRYRMDGKFEEGKKNGEEKKSEDEEKKSEDEAEKSEDEVQKSEGQIEKEVAAGAQDSPPKKELAQTHGGTTKQTSQEQKLQEQMPVLPAKIPSPHSEEAPVNESLSLISHGPKIQQQIQMPSARINMHFAYHQDRPMPLPKRSKVSKKKNAPTSNETHMNHPAMTNESPLFSRGYPKMTSQIQRELLLNQSMMSHEVATGRPAISLGPTGSSTMSNHIHSTNHMMIDVERAGRIERMIEAERIIGLARLNPDHHGGNATFGN